MHKDRHSIANSIGGVLAAAVALALAAGAAQAAEEEEEEGSARRAGALEEVMVTSRRREETLQDAPLSVTAFSELAIEARSLSSFNDLNNYAPNIELNNGRVDGGGSVAQLYIRGVGQEDYSFPNDPGVGVYLDGVYVSRSSAGDFGFMDIERIEVLRGPQGSLYGKNTIGGAINVITKKPEGLNAGMFELTVGRFDRVDIQGNYDFAIADGWYGKVSGMSRSRDGYGVNILGEPLRERNQDAGRFQLLRDRGDGLSWQFQMDFSEQRATGPVGALRQFWPGDIPDLVNSTTAPARAEELGLEPPFDTFNEAWINRIDDTDNFVSGGLDETRDNNEIFGTSLTVDRSFDNVDFKSITAFRRVEIDVQRDGDHTPFDVFTVAIDERTYQFSQEFQLSGNARGGQFPWVVGIFGINERGFNSFQAPLIDGVFEEIGLDISLITDTLIDTTSLAVFGEATWYLNDNLGLIFGGRINEDDKEYTYQLDRIFSGESVIPRITLNESWTEFLPRVGIEYSLGDSLIYSHVAEGFKAGGWNPRTLTAGVEPQQFEPEEIITLEVGAKTTLLDGRATLNAAVFFSEYTDIQLIAVTEVELPDGTNTVDTNISNAGEGEIFGAEVEFTVRPTDNILITSGLGLLDTEFTDLGQEVIDAGTATLDSDFIQSPEVTFNSAFEYTAGLGNNGNLIFFTDVAFKSEIQRSVQNFEDLVTDDYWIWNGRITWVPPSERFEVAAFVTNITDEIYLTNGVDVRGLGATEAYYSRPREWGLTLKARF